MSCNHTMTFTRSMSCAQAGWLQKKQGLHWFSGHRRKTVARHYTTECLLFKCVAQAQGLGSKSLAPSFLLVFLLCTHYSELALFYKGPEGACLLDSDIALFWNGYWPYSQTDNATAYKNCKPLQVVYLVSHPA